MIDLHILHHVPSTTPDWWKACIQSAQAAEAMGLCALHIIEATGTSIGANRAAAFRLGQHPLVAYLDNDDVLIPEGIPAMLAALAQRPDVCGVYSDRQQIDDSGNVLFDLNRSAWRPEDHLCRVDFPHMLAIYRREAVTPHLATVATFENYSELVLSGLAVTAGPWLHVPTLAYQRREKSYYVGHVRPIPPDLAQRAHVAILRPLLDAHRARLS